MTARLSEALARLPQAHVAVCGDFCLDAYWDIDPDEGEVSVETGLPVRRVRTQDYSPGGAANVVANLCALGVGEVHVVGLAGDDVFGPLLRRILSEAGADVSGLLDGGPGWQTMVFGKPHVGGVEQNRIDFGGFNEPSAGAADALAGALDAAARRCTAVVLNQQVPGGTCPPGVIERLNAVVAAHPAPAFLVDSRDRAALYRGGSLKVNAHEAARLCGRPRPLGVPVPREEAQACARELCGRTGRPAFVTCGADGICVADGGRLDHVPGIALEGPLDPVGAGDTAVAALAAVMGSGGDARTAALVANLAAAVTVRKLHTTGTATPAEIRALAARAGAGAG
ncbi:MAG: carbohydrate kinase [Candidatus Brocadiaceae bacterium]|mgnify:CR=1 FL=1|nr:carbohydrate kinase [Candidatus Brocadiaceae bacterium]